MSYNFFPLAKAISSFAYPFGIYNDEDINIINASDYESAVTTDEGVADNNSLFQLKRIKASGKDNFFAFIIIKFFY